MLKQRGTRQTLIGTRKRKLRNHASYVRIPPDEPGCRIVTLETAPLADRTQIPRGPLWENERIFPATSCNFNKSNVSLSWY